MRRSHFLLATALAAAALPAAESQSPIAAVRFSPDGTELAFMSNRSGKNQVYTMDAATGGNVVRITHTNVDEWAPVWAH